MKAISLVVLFGCGIWFTACESTQTSQSGGNQEAKRRAAMAQQKQQPVPDEGHANLLEAQQDLLNRDGNPMRSD